MMYFLSVKTVGLFVVLYLCLAFGSGQVNENGGGEMNSIRSLRQEIEKMASEIHELASSFENENENARGGGGAKRELLASSLDRPGPASEGAVRREKPEWKSGSNGDNKDDDDKDDSDDDSQPSPPPPPPPATDSVSPNSVDEPEEETLPLPQPPTEPIQPEPIQPEPIQPEPTSHIHEHTNSIRESLQEMQTHLETQEHAKLEAVKEATQKIQQHQNAFKQKILEEVAKIEEKGINYHKNSEQCQKSFQHLTERLKEFAHKLGKTAEVLRLHEETKIKGEMEHGGKKIDTEVREFMHSIANKIETHVKSSMGSQGIQQTLEATLEKIKKEFESIENAVKSTQEQIVTYVNKELGVDEERIIDYTNKEIHADMATLIDFVGKMSGQSSENSDQLQSSLNKQMTSPHPHVKHEWPQTPPVSTME